MEEGREKGTECIAARARRKHEREKRAAASLAREERSGAELKLKGGEEYYGGEEEATYTGERMSRSGRRKADDGIARE